jgi:hypothetical protein
VTLDAATAIGDLVLGERRKEASGRPAFLVGAQNRSRRSWPSAQS